MRLALTAVLLAAATTAGPAFAESRGFPVGGFDRVASSCPFDVRVHTGGRPGVRADGPREMLDRLRIEVVGGELRIGTKPGGWPSDWRWGGSRDRAVVDVSVPMVSGVSLSGPGNVDVDRIRTPNLRLALSGPGDLRIGVLEARDLEIGLSGPGNVAAAGRADRTRIRLSGPGDIRAERLATHDVDISLSGPGNVTLAADGQATGHLSGPGDIRILGRARCSITKSGPGDVRCG